MPDLLRRLLRLDTASASFRAERRLVRSAYRWVTALAAPTLMLACSNAEPSPFGEKLESTYWALELNHHAVLLSTTAPWDTLPLTATPLNHLGQLLTGVGVPQYSSTDIKHVSVTSDGVLHAIGPLAPGQEVVVTARLTVNNVTHADTVYVRVMETPNPPPVLESFSIHPVPPDSAKMAGLRPSSSSTIDFSFPYVLFSKPPIGAWSSDRNGDSLPNLPVAIRSSDPTSITVDRATGQFVSGGEGARLPGSVTLYASTTAFGVSKADTLSYQIGWPVMSSIQVQSVPSSRAGTGSVPAFVPSEVKVGTGALVLWQEFPADANTLGDADITFADAQLPYVIDPQTSPSLSFVIALMCQGLYVGPADCNAGKIAIGPSHPLNAFRVFTAPGTYEYHSAALGISGRVIVVDER